MGNLKDEEIRRKNIVMRILIENQFWCILHQYNVTTSRDLPYDMRQTCMSLLNSFDLDNMTIAVEMLKSYINEQIKT